MEVETVRSLYGIAGIVGILVLAWFGLMFVVSRFSDGIAESYDNVRRRLTPVALFLAWGVAMPCLARGYMGNRRTLVVFRLPEVGAFRSTSQRRSSWLLALPTTSMGCKAWRPAASASILLGVEWRE